jgi:hypothetical protein
VEHPEVPDVAHHHDKSGTSNKDLSVDSNLRQVVVDDPDRFIDSDPQSKFYDLTNRLETAFCDLHSVLGINVKQPDIEAMQRMISGGMPLSFIIQNMQVIYQKKLDENDRIRRFTYYEDAISKAWDKELLKKEATPPPVPSGKNQQPRNKSSYKPTGKPKLPVHKPTETVTDEEYEEILRKVREREAASKAVEVRR